MLKFVGLKSVAKTSLTATNRKKNMFSGFVKLGHLAWSVKLVWITNPSIVEQCLVTSSSGGMSKKLCRGKTVRVWTRSCSGWQRQNKSNLYSTFSSIYVYFATLSWLNKEDDVRYFVDVDQIVCRWTHIIIKLYLFLQCHNRALLFGQQRKKNSTPQPPRLSIYYQPTPPTSIPIPVAKLCRLPGTERSLNM